MKNKIIVLWEKETESQEKGKSSWEATERKDQEKLQKLIQQLLKSQKTKNKNDRRIISGHFFMFKIKFTFLRKVLQEDLPIRLVVFAVVHRLQVHFLKYHSKDFLKIVIVRRLKRFPKYRLKG